MMHSMFPIIPLATDPGDLRPVESLALTTPLVVAIVACLLLAVGLIALIIMLSRPARKPRNSDRARGAHSNASSKAEWRARIDDVVARHESGALPRHEAFVELSVIARDFAGAASGKELSSSTLTDLAYLNRTPANRQGLDALKQTIGALYPPEFADDARNRIAQTTSVQQAAELAIAMQAAGEPRAMPMDYEDVNVGAKVVKLIQSYTPIVNETVWLKR